MVRHKLHVDFESRSVVDLKRFGLYVYANHPSTEAWCMAYAFNDEPVQLWKEGEPLPKRVADHVKSGGIVVGHNVAFEWHIWNYIMKPRYGWPTLKLSQLECTMARAYAMALPGSLKMLAQALNIPQRKFMDGHAIMMKMCKPRKIEDDGSVVWWDEADKKARLYEYCMIDVDVERACDAEMFPLSDSEHEIWQLDLRINARGIRVDRKAAKATLQLVAREMKRLDKMMSDATGGQITRVNQAKALLAWCQAAGVQIDKLRKNDVRDILEEPDLPFEVREALEIRTNAAKVSVTKLETMVDMTLVDGRARGQFQYHGATTGRASGRGIQLHNLPRPEDKWSDPKLQDRLLSQIAEHMIDEDFIGEWYGPFMRVVSSCIRGYLIPDEGKEFIGADLRNIEGVCLPWLAGEEWKLEAFRKNFWHGGPGMYEMTAGRILKKDFSDVTKSERQAYGKVSELALGFQGWVGAYHQMAVNYFVKVTDEQAEDIARGWREANPLIVKYWKDVENAALNACLNPGGKYFAGAKGRQVSFRIVGEFLMCMLPSGRPLIYPYPSIIETERYGQTKMAVTIMTVDSRVGSKTKGQFVRQQTYGGKLVENITQAVARDVLFGSQPRLEKAGYPIVLHVHDENVSEVPIGFGSVEEYEEIMTIVPAWATDMPIAAEGFRGARYRK
jgi:DNA polymerase bacteriophage-type